MLEAEHGALGKADADAQQRQNQQQRRQAHEPRSGPLCQAAARPTARRCSGVVPALPRSVNVPVSSFWICSAAAPAVFCRMMHAASRPISCPAQDCAARCLRRAAFPACAALRLRYVRRSLEDGDRDADACREQRMQSRHEQRHGDASAASARPTLSCRPIEKMPNWGATLASTPSAISASINATMTGKTSSTATRERACRDFGQIVGLDPVQT